VSETDNGLQPKKKFEEFEIQRLHDGQLKKTLKSLQTCNVDTRLNKIQSFIQVHVSISFSQCSAFVIYVPCWGFHTIYKWHSMACLCLVSLLTCFNSSNVLLTIEHDQRDANSFLLEGNGTRGLERNARIERSESKEMEGEDPKGSFKMVNRRSLDISRRSVEAFTFLFEPTPPLPPASPSRGLTRQGTWPARATRYFDM
jgi:hypothetical protein